MKVLMVCPGNICRSPLAESILREKTRRAGLPHHQRSRRFTADDFQYFDKIYAMAGEFDPAKVDLLMNEVHPDRIIAKYGHPIKIS
ncbi:MAG TPA: hypothetical protein VGS79_01605 [Puia sp.]|nr:hypothetical protein [Puia sp.]